MAPSVSFEVDELFLSTEKLFGHPQIKKLLRSGKTVGSNPNPEKYQSVNVKFIPFKKSVLQAVMANLTQFEFTDKKGNSNTADVKGPFFVKGEESLYIGQFKGDIREGKGI